MAHRDEIQHQIMKKINPAFLALSETRLTVLGYSVIRWDKKYRGVVLYVKNDIKYEIVLVKKLESNCWCVVVEWKEKLYKGVIMVIYHSPRAHHTKTSWDF